jgi:hypothetical protein
MIIANDSFMDADDISEDDNALFCHTTLTSCCRNPNRGDWFYPNGNIVDKKITIPLLHPFYRDRGTRVVRLHHRGNSSQRGRFKCVIPNHNDIDQSVFVNIGRSYILSFVSIHYDYVQFSEPWKSDYLSH